MAWGSISYCTIGDGWKSEKDTLESKGGRGTKVIGREMTNWLCGFQFPARQSSAIIIQGRRKAPIVRYESTD